MKYEFRLVRIVVTVFFSLPLNLALASIGDSVDNTNADGLEDVLVTARWRTESIVNVPLSIASISAEDITAAGLTELESLAALAPNLDFQNVGNSQPGRWNSGIRFRGMDVDISTPTNQTGGFFVDGIPVLGGISSVSFSDIQSVDVIRGPQPVYFGRGTFGGAINYTTVTPSSGFAGRLAVSYSPSFGSNDSSLWLEGGGDVITMRGTGFNRVVGAAFRSSADDGELGEERSFGYSLIVAATPDETFSAKLRVAQSQDDDASPAAAFIPYRLVFPAGFTAGSLPYREQLLSRNTDFFDDPEYGSAAAFINATPNANGPDLNHYGYRSELTTASLTAEYKPTPLLTAAILLGVSQREAGNLRDVDQYRAEGWITKSYLIHDTASAELRLIVDNDGAVRAVLGASYVELQQDGDIDGGLNFFPNLIFRGRAFPLVGYGISRRETETINTTGVFASVSYDVIDTVTLTLEARFQQEDFISLQAAHINSDGQDGLPTDRSSDTVLPRVSVVYSPLPNTTAYLSYAEAELPGGVNNLADYVYPLFPQFSPTIPEQTLGSWELGWKQELFAQRLRITAAAFKQDWQNMRSFEAFFGPRDANDDGVLDAADDISGDGRFDSADYATLWQATSPGSSSQMGVELAAQMSVGERWYLSAVYGYTASQYDDYRNEGVEFRGKTLPRSPRHSGALSVAWSAQLSSTWHYTLRGDTSFRGQSYVNAENTVTIDAYTLLNLRLSIESGALAFGLACTNCTDRTAWAMGTEGSDFAAGGRGVIVDPIMPRELAVFGAIRF